MALDVTKLYPIRVSGEGSLFIYITDDANAAIIADGYFDGTYGKCDLRVGDIILCAADMDGTPEFVPLVVTVGGSDVTVTDNVTST